MLPSLAALLVLHPSFGQPKLTNIPSCPESVRIAYADVEIILSNTGNVKLSAHRLGRAQLGPLLRTDIKIRQRSWVEDFVLVQSGAEQSFELTAVRQD